MPKAKLTATLPDGSVATRTTARTYTHVVAVRRSFEYAMTHANRSGASDGSNWDYNNSIIEGKHDGHAGNWGTPDQIAARRAKRIEEAKDSIGSLSRAEYIEARRAGYVAAIELKKEEGYYDKWTAESWAGRLDLAQKAATPKPWFAEVKIVPVN